MYAQLDERVRYATRTGAREGRCGVRKINGACSILHVVYYKSDEALVATIVRGYPLKRRF